MRGFTIERAAGVILFLLVFALAVRIPLDTDTWWHLRSGETMLASGIIYADPFSFTMNGQPWVNHSWGAQLLMTLLYRVGGDWGLAFYTAGLATLGMIFVYRISVGSVYLRAFVIVLAAATAAVFWSPRPQMLSFFLSTVVLVILTQFRRRQSDRLWLLPPLMALWGNLHAGFSLGFILMGGVIAGEALGLIFNPRRSDGVGWRGVGKLILIGLVSAGALVINPYGLNMLLVPFQTIGIGVLRNFIQEWNSPNFQEAQIYPFVALIIFTVGAAGASRKRLGWTDFVLFSGTLFMSLLAGRNIALFAIVAAPILAEHLDDVLAERGWVLRPMRRVSPRLGILNAALVVLVGIGALGKILVTLAPRAVDEARRAYLPVDAVEFLQAQPEGGALFNSYNWGGYLMFAMPERPVFVDGRTDLYGDALLTTYLRTATGAPGWRETLDEYRIQWVFVETGSGLALNLRDDPGWRTAYSDALASVFERVT